MSTLDYRMFSSAIMHTYLNHFLRCGGRTCQILNGAQGERKIENTRKISPTVVNDAILSSKRRQVLSLAPSLFASMYSPAHKKEGVARVGNAHNLLKNQKVCDCT